MKEVQRYYQYTDLNAFKSIIESKVFWATNAFYLNDYQEYRPINTLIDEFIQHNYGISSDKNILYEFSKIIRRLMRHQTWRVPFVVSFSKKSDSLSQWRGYADDGKGVSIGITFKEQILMNKIDLEELICDDKPIDIRPDQWYHIKVKYLDETWEGKIWSYLARVYTSFEENFEGDEENINSDGENNISLELEKIVYPLWLASLGTKNFGFSEEEEVRLIKIIPANMYTGKFPDVYYTDLQYRIGKYGITPYLLIEFKKNFDLVEVVLGPNYFGDESDVKDFLYKNKFPHELEVNRSRISYH